MVQGLLKGMAVGLELVESVAVGMELMEIEETRQRRQRLFKVTSKIIEDGLLLLEHGKSDRVELTKGQPNCPTVTAKSGELNAGEGMISGLQIMGVFALCSALMTLSWGGVTSMLVMTAKAWAVKPAKESLDASTNTETPSNRGTGQLLKLAAVSFSDKRTRWEWPRRAVPVGRRIRWAHAWSVDEGQVAGGSVLDIKS